MSNVFGHLFCITTWGESHGKAIGVVIDGCPAGLEISEEEINFELSRRSPGKKHTSQRKEPDLAEIYSGVFEGKSTGAPISVLIHNRDADSTKYEAIKDLVRPGHANFTYLEKYGIFDYRGGGRASARETACRVAAGAIAKKFVKTYGIEIAANIVELGESSNPLEFERLLEETKEKGDSIGGVIECTIRSITAGLGEPIYRKIEAMLASAMLSLPACKGFEMGQGFYAAKMRGSQYNDIFIEKGKTATNHAGGSLGGITNGMPVIFRTAFKPTSSIFIDQPTVSITGQKAVFRLPDGSRHDPCVALRAPPIIEAMAALVVADALLLHRSSRI